MFGLGRLGISRTSGILNTAVIRSMNSSIHGRRAATLLLTAAILAGCSEPTAVPPGQQDNETGIVAQDTPAWRRRAMLPTGRTSAEMAVVTDANGHTLFYVFGGADSTGFFGQLATVEAYDPATNAWSPKAPMPDGGRWGMSGSAVINGKVYLPGGWNGLLSSDGPQSDLFEYTPATDTWRTITGARQTAEGVSGVIGGQLYVLTGQDTEGPQGYLDRFDHATETWTALPTAPTEHFGASGGVIGGKFYIAGGANNAVGTHDQLDVYDPATNIWTTKAPMPTARSSATGVVMNDKLYVIGSTVDIYDPATDSWSSVPGAPYTISSFAAASAMDAGGHWMTFVAGGIAANHFSHRTWVYDPSL